ncbi:CRISPR-associated protein Cas8c/Csd1, subtype I-C/DVULG [endosymbiont of Ridgeia piscesae]|jgi:CRISPR-associated protein Csd1|uniref:CRISPR-associated protein Cas8c/Csd1, subtype I-C/DVULG n=2 Tax=endosymbiont of Ridgeia piscesae TaxID=54398 RepID=A0A0T5YVX5_9GAMM|nr:type I-C CRISPR-associated protein Cas8c/Csd1 [endosymbiont of Ridgeia piscesae]KRT54700.1 CRISPR-associated protein Cas8c/Csd1, subtype I-C/DVULG [endosymbiont of Ridgeia piscesae]
MTAWPTTPPTPSRPPGYSLQKIAFAVVIHPDGRLHQISDLRDHSGKKAVPIQRLLPGQAKPSGSGLNPCFLWDNSAYLLGHVAPRQAKESIDKYRKRAVRTQESFAAFRERHLKLEEEIDDPAFSAICRFLEEWACECSDDHPLLGEISSGFGLFQLLGETRYLHEYPAIRAWWQRQDEVGPLDAAGSICLVTGQPSPIASIHEPKIKGVGGAQSSGALLVSFNCDAFTSYDKSQSHNAPVSEAATFRYATALNGLLSGPHSHRHRFSLGDTTIAFWTGETTVAEGWLSAMFSGDLNSNEAQDAATLQQIEVLLKALRSGGDELRALGDDPATPIYLLGLAPNAARLSVRFWHTDTLGHLFDRLKAHYEALRIVPQFEAGSKRPDPEFPPSWRLLRETARESKDIPPLLAGALMRAILEGTPYPDSLAGAVIRRIRADRTINFYRAAVLKAWLTRLNCTQGGIPVSLDTERTDPAYRLGRLFAVLEKTQEDALPGINATIRERFYSAASATPSMVFPRLLRTYQHHLAKLVSGAKVNREKLVQEIVDGLDTMPPHLNLEAQALFAIGYYHQRKALFGGNKAQDMTTDDKE